MVQNKLLNEIKILKIRKATLVINYTTPFKNTSFSDHLRGKSIIILKKFQQHIYMDSNWPDIQEYKLIQSDAEHIKTDAHILICCFPECAWNALPSWANKINQSEKDNHSHLSLPSATYMPILYEFKLS